MTIAFSDGPLAYARIANASAILSRIDFNPFANFVTARALAIGAMMGYFFYNTDIRSFEASRYPILIKRKIAATGGPRTPKGPGRQRV